MAVTFRNAGALAANATTTTLNVVAPTGLANNDILVVAVLGKDNQVITFPGAQNGISAWTKFVEVNNGTAQRLTLGWARVTDGGLASGSTIGVTKPTDNNLLFCGVCSAWIGAISSGDPTTGAGTPTTSPNELADAVTYATFDPLIACHVVAIGVYNNDLTTAGAISGTDPTFANRWDLETATGADGSIFGYSGDSTGVATGARSHSTTSSADDINIGCLFGLEPLTTQTFPQTLTATAVPSTATRQLQANKPMTATIVTSTATRQLQANKDLVATVVSSIATAVKAAQKGIAATAVTSAATMDRGLTLGRMLTATVITSTATMARAFTFGSILAATAVTSAATMARGLTFGRVLTATVVSSVAVLRRYRGLGVAFLFTAANWSAGAGKVFEVYMRAVVGTARARLWNETDGAEVAASEVTTTASSYQRLRSPQLSLVDAKLYRAQFGTDGADSGAVKGAKVIIIES